MILTHIHHKTVLKKSAHNPLIIRGSIRVMGGATVEVGKKRENMNQNPSIINITFQVKYDKLAEFIKSVNKLKKAGVI